jgi:acetate kinase
MPMPRVLILNAGSSTLKWGVLDASTRAVSASGTTTWSADNSSAQASALGSTLQDLAGIDAVGHRVVHGGTRFSRAVLIDPEVQAAIQDLAPLAPLHNPAALAGIKATERLLPGVPQVAAFDTAFHSTMPPAAAIYPLPWEWTERWGLRRLGFHGLSVQYAVQRATEMLGSLPARLVVCHLGAGCSITAVAMGRSVDTTMGFTPLEGLMMAVRSGSVDPGLLLYLLRDEHVGVQELEATLDGRSGLLGTSGISADLRAIIEAAQAGHERAQLAIDMFVHRVIGAVGGMIGILGGIDALIFTGGIGEHSPLIRQRVTDSFGYFGLRLDPGPNAAVSSDADIASSESAARVLVISAREDLAILTEVTRLLWPAGRQGAT